MKELVYLEYQDVECDSRALKSGDGFPVVRMSIWSPEFEIYLALTVEQARELGNAALFGVAMGEMVAESIVRGELDAS